MTEPEPAPITKAKSDMADFDRKINAIKAEESRLALQRTGMERERERIKAFADMYPRYTSPEPSESRQVHLAASSQVMAEAHGLLSANGEDHIAPEPSESKEASPSATADSPQRNGHSLPQKRTKRRQALYRKPKATPKMTDMITDSLRDARKRGLPGLKPKEMAEFIRQKWWPHLKGEAVGPIAWRMLRNRELEKNGGLYVLPSS